VGLFRAHPLATKSFKAVIDELSNTVAISETINTNIDRIYWAKRFRQDKVTRKEIASCCSLIFCNYLVAVILSENIIIAALIFLKFP
jgi:hypothetical protein